MEDLSDVKQSTIRVSGIVLETISDTTHHKFTTVLPQYCRWAKCVFFFWGGGGGNLTEQNLGGPGKKNLKIF